MAQTGAYGPIVPWDIEILREGTLTGIEAASQSYKKGSPLINSSGSLATAAADPTAMRGIALTDASGTTGARVEYWPLKAGRLYAMVFDGVLAQSDIYSNVGIAKDSTTGYWSAVAAETEDTVTIQAIAPGWAVGDTKPYVLVTFDAANIEGA